MKIVSGFHIVLSHYTANLDKVKEQEPIFFVKCENQPSPHPTDSSCRPDFVGIRKSRDEAWEDKNISEIFKDREWSHFEATGEIKSAGKTSIDAHLQAASYTNYLLQARPDLTHVLGIYVEEGGFRLALSNPCGIAYLKPLSWRNQSASAILYAWLTRLYDPFKDPIITRVTRPDDVTFSLRINNTTYEGCRLINTGIAFGRRTTIFEGTNTNSEEEEEDIIIKIQYIEIGRRFSEPATLDHIHDTVPFPGVVRIKAQIIPLQEADKVIVKLGRSEEGENDTKTRQRTCLVMVDKGMSLMTAETPQAALIAIYDLLEVGRLLYRERSTLHRDISEGNALIRAKPSNATEAMEKRFEDMHFATSLLGEDGPDPTAGRLQTPLLLIDFDMGEILNDGIKGEPMPRTGTPIFMARVVRSGKIREGPHHSPPMPQLQVGLERYRKHLPSRLETFPPNQAVDKRIYDEIILENFHHELRYDAESVFWLLVWWAIQAKPKASEGDDDHIPKICWDTLTAGDENQDGRRHFIDPFPKEVLHPSYQPLEALLRAMSLQLAGDFALMEDRSNPEYLHEAFQRLVFEFLSEHGRKNSDFLILPKSQHLREVEKIETMNQPKITGPRARQDTKGNHSKANSSASKRGRDAKDDGGHTVGTRASKRVSCI
ncbi:hypothetical protein CPB86DRAFT_710269 [Serendipita vermifera]|nr:hypothetical protein CPB86DRAFT_710269 [Serendipita vermifera]